MNVLKTLVCYTRTSHYQVPRRTMWKIIFFGTDDFSCETLRALANAKNSSNGHKLVSSLDVCAGGNLAVRKFCKENMLTLHEWPFIVPPDRYDIGIVVSFGHLIHSESIANCKFGMINAHPSLLPRWRGAAPIHHTVLNGDAETGVTILEVSPNKFDIGKILMQDRYAVPSNCSTRILSNILSLRASAMVLKVLRDLPFYLANSYPQPKDGVTIASKLKPEMGLIQWCRSSLDIDRQIRAFSGFIKLYTHWKSMKVIILDTLNADDAAKAQVDILVKASTRPGFLFYHKRRKTLFVKCKDGWIGISTLSIPKRGEITASDFYNGFMTKVETKEWFFA